MSTALHFLNRSWHPALKNLFLQGYACCLSQYHTTLKVFPNTQNYSFWNLGMRNFKYKDREMEKACSKCSKEAGWLSKGTDLFGQCNLQAKLSYSTYSTSKSLMNFWHFWWHTTGCVLLLPTASVTRKWQDYKKKSVMFPVVLGSSYTRISSRDVLLSSTAQHDSSLVLTTGF